MNILKKTTLLIVDDHLMIREMWMKLFALKSDLDVVGDCGKFDEAIAMVKAKKPDIVLLDINLPPASGLNAVPLIRKFSPGTKIIAVSMHTEPAYAKKMLQLGAKAYITKNSSYLEMYNAIEQVMMGKTYICSEMKSILAEKFVVQGNDEPDSGDLSLREIEIIKLIKAGLTSKEISEQLNISFRTVNVHRQKILKKLNLKNTVALINFINTNDPQF